MVLYYSLIIFCYMFTVVNLSTFSSNTIILFNVSLEFVKFYLSNYLLYGTFTNKCACLT